MKRDALTITVIIAFLVGLVVILLINPFPEKTKNDTSESASAELITPVPEDNSGIIPPALEEGQDNEPIVIGTSDIEIYTVSPAEFFDPPADTVIPDFYRRLEIPYLKTQVFGFTDSSGEVALRAYGTCYEMINNVRQSEITGFWPVEIVKDGNGMPFISAKVPKEIAEDTEENVNVPERAGESRNDSGFFSYFVVDTNLYTCFDNNLNQSYRTWGADGQLYPCDSSGNIMPGALPVDYSMEQLNLYETLPDSGSITVADFSYPLDLGLRIHASVIPGGVQ